LLFNDIYLETYPNHRWSYLFTLIIDGH